MRIAAVVVGLTMALLAWTALPGAARACDEGRQGTAAVEADRIEGRVAALLTAEVAGPSREAASLGVTLLVRSDSRLVTVAVLDGAEILATDGAPIAADEIPPSATVLITGRWTGEETFEATRVELS